MRSLLRKIKQLLSHLRSESHSSSYTVYDDLIIVYDDADIVLFGKSDK